MASGSMPITSAQQSSVLERVKLFLPTICKANQELEQAIRSQGAGSVQIDRHLCVPGISSGQGLETTRGYDDSDGDGDGDDESDEDSDSEQNPTLGDSSPSSTKQRVIQLEFALGDFDDTPIALAEAADAAEAAAVQGGPEDDNTEHGQGEKEEEVMETSSKNNVRIQILSDKD